MHGEGGQATVEWVALVLVAALALGAAAKLSPTTTDRELGELVAKRITGTPGEPALASGETGRRALASREAAASPPPRAAAPSPPRAAAPPPPRAAAPSPPRAAAPPPPRAAAPPASTPRAVDAFRRLRGVADVAKHTWIVCLGYRRWRYELRNPSAPTESLPLAEALSIVNTCLNPYDYLLED